MKRLEKIRSYYQLLKQAIRGSDMDYTSGSIRKAVFMLAIPMILEMSMESVFAVVDIFFVGRLNDHAVEAVATVAITESVLTIIYSMAIGLSMAATAVVARRIGEKNKSEAAHSGAQAITLTVMITVIISILGVVFAPEILGLMGANAEVIEMGSGYTRIVYGSSLTIMLLFLINGIFRGAGDASLAMRSLWIANGINIVLDPILIFGWGPFPELGLEGAAIATVIGRGTGVCYQLYHLLNIHHIIKINRAHFKPDWSIIRSMINIASTATFQFIIASASWIIMTRILASISTEAVAGYQVAIRILLFFILPAWGLSNAAATLVGQNLGANMPDRAEKSVWVTAKYNAIFMALVSILFLLFSDQIIYIINKDETIKNIATEALKIISLGYVFYGVGMVMANAFNGAGDTRTPTWINFFGFWIFQIPLAYFLTLKMGWNEKGVFYSILFAESLITLIAVILFKKGRWKKVQV